MKAVHNDVVLGLSVAVLAALGSYKATSFSSGAEIFPLIVLVPMVIVGLVIAIRGQIKLVKSGDNPVFYAHFGRFISVVLLIVLALVGLNYLGFLTTSAIVIPCISFLLGYRKPLPVAIVTVSFIAVVYIVFIKLLARPLPSEIWTLLS